MCGIFCSIRAQDTEEGTSSDFETLSTELRRANALRGPDAQSTHKLTAGDKTIEFFGSELRLRGTTPIVQPHVLDGDALCWNGEIFDGDLKVEIGENDGVNLVRELRRRRTKEEICALIGSIEGPYAFVYYDSQQQTIFFARDPLGRRSLLLHRPTVTAPYLLLSSVTVQAVSTAAQFEEVSTDSIYCVDLVSLGRSEIVKGYPQSLTTLPRASDCDESPRPNFFTTIRPVNDSIPPEDLAPPETLDHIRKHLQAPVDGLINVLSDSVRRRVESIPPLFEDDGNPIPRLGVLFSGGIDSTVVAFLAHSHLEAGEPIDLLNVAFENPRKLRPPGNPNAKNSKKKKIKPNEALDEAASTLTAPYMVPDRVTGIRAAEELRRLCPSRKWNFVEVNVPYEESQAAIPTIESLMLPGRTVMDLSLASALYFASRGVGVLQDPSSSDPEPVPYTSRARVLLNGLGSDELLGGYGRHRTAYTTGGWAAVIQELQLEIVRLPSRNLGRDDRVVSSHGKESRHPFLSLSVVQAVTQLPVHHKLDPRAGLGLGDKLLLRLAARKLGLVEACERKKKAMQFGSHSARMHGEKKGDAMLE